MMLPGLASARVPAQVRLFAALAVSAALAPVLSGSHAAMTAARSLPDLLALTVLELWIGALLGLAARVVFAGFQFAFVSAASFLGLSGIGDVSVEDSTPQPALASLMELASIMLFLAAGLHVELIASLATSYEWAGPGELRATGALEDLTSRLSRAFDFALRVAAPFIVLSVLLNTAFAVLNKIAPQIPVFFVAQPVVLAGGLVLLFLTSDEQLQLFSTTAARELGGR